MATVVPPRRELTDEELLREYEKAIRRKHSPQPKWQQRMREQMEEYAEQAKEIVAEERKK